MGEAKIRGGDAYVNDAAGVGGVFEAGGHRMRAACGVYDDIGEVAAGGFLKIGEVGAVGFDEDAGFDAEGFRAEIETAFDHVHDNDVHAFHKFEEL